MRMSRSRLTGTSAVLGATVLALALAAWAGPALAQVTVFSPHFDEVRRASVTWDLRKGPERQVVDMVCLVPDLPTFLEAVSLWDETHYFPILIDDVEYSFKFLRAFRPARVVRYPGKAAALTPGSEWDRATSAVGKAWVGEGKDAPRGDVKPASLGPTPPGVVLSTPDSPSLAGAVALAAGRFQPLLKWESPKHFADVPSIEEANQLAISLETLVAERFSKYDELGDDCDFVTLAGDYPYRYNRNGRIYALDDLIARSGKTLKRWAYTGRLTGDVTQSVYRAMSSLFLHSSSALMFNSYSENGQPWKSYTMGGAVNRLATLFKVTHRNGDRADVAGWHQAFDPVNRFGLVVINSSGDPWNFNLPGGQGQTSDIPESNPAAVLMIHSFSAATPDDPNTIAGRWLANGAFLFYGSVQEPYLTAFRPPALVASFLAENLPVVTAVRQTEGEFRGPPDEYFGPPWRLIFLGDPLYRVRPTSTPTTRLAAWEPVSGWNAYREFIQPKPEEPENRRLSWVLKTAIYRLQSGTRTRQQGDLTAVLLGIARDRLDPALQPLYDDLVADLLFQEGRTAELIDRLSRISQDGRSPSVRRHLETAQMAALQRALAAKDARQAIALWNEVIRVPASRDFVRLFTDRVGRLAGTPTRLADWRTRLQSALQANAEPSNTPVIEAELKRVEEKLKVSKREP